MKTNEIIQLIILTIIIFILYRVLNSLGIIGKTDSDRTNEMILESDYFKPRFWSDYKSTGKQTMLLKTDAINTAIERILKGRTLRIASTLFTNYKAVTLSAFDNVKYKTQVSFLADKYQQQTGRSLISDLVFILPSDTLSALTKKLNKLPIS